MSLVLASLDASHPRSDGLAWELEEQDAYDVKVPEQYKVRDFF